MDCVALELDNYREFIKLDEFFQKQTPAPQLLQDRLRLVEKLLEFLHSENLYSGISVNTNIKSSTYKEKRSQLYILLTIRKPNPLPHWFNISLDSLLQREVLEKNVLDAESLKRISEAISNTNFKVANQCALWKGDITNLKIDAIVHY